MKVYTVLGQVDIAELGITLPHEHVFLDMLRVYPPHSDMLLNDPELATREVSLFKEAGGGTIVDVTPPDLGRDPEGLAEVSRKTGAHILMSTGRYHESSYETDVWERSTTSLASEFESEIVDGLGGIRAALFGEIGTRGSNVSPAEERVHRAVARAHRRTGAPITTHSLGSAVGLQQLDIFQEEKVDLRRVAIGHCDSFPRIDYYEAILARGAYVQFDAIRGTEPGLTTRHLGHIKELAARGFLDRVLVSHDVCSRQHYVGAGGKGYTFIPGEFRELLGSQGFGSNQIDDLVSRNPQRFLGGD